MISRNELQTATGGREIQPGFDSLAGFELMQRIAKMFTTSELVPTIYREVIPARGKTPAKQNPGAMANCVVALNMAVRLQADPLMVMQNLYIIEGRPAWSAQWIVAQINTSGRFSPLRFDVTKPAPEREIQYTETEWKQDRDGRNIPAEVVKKLKIRDQTFVAWAVEKETGDRLEGIPVTIEMAVKEGWMTRKGSKWQTIPELMGRWRAASFFGRQYCPERLMGLPSDEEAKEAIDAERNSMGVYVTEPEPMDRESLSAEQVDDNPQEGKQGGYQPKKSEANPNPPPKKP